MADRFDKFGERAPNLPVYDRWRIGHDAGVIRDCLQMGGRLLGQPKPNERRPQAGFASGDADPVQEERPYGGFAIVGSTKRGWRP